MTPAPLDMSERLDRLRLIRSENVGPITFRQLLIRFGTATRALEAIPSLANKGGRKRRLRIASRAEAQSELDALTRIGGHMVHWGQPDYPAALAATEDAPPVLSVLGHLHLLTKPCIGIVGSRNASTNGKRLAQQFAKALGDAGYCVISGLASGIDAAAHFGSLSSGTIAAVARGTVGQARHFPRRNRIISGMASAVLVVEATQRSGSLITARLAADQGREVFAIPGSPLDPRARGANDLIRKGAALIETPEEMIGILNNMPAPQLDAPSNPEFIPGTGPQPNEEDLLHARALMDQALSPTSVAIDDLIADLNLAPALVAMVILELELAGLAERHPGNRISRLAPEPSSIESNNEKPTKTPASLQKQADLF